MIQKNSHHSIQIIEGIRQYCKEKSKTFSLSSVGENKRLIAGTVYIITEEIDLANVIKQLHKSELILGQNIGIISFEETVLKELLDITTFSTDSEQMANCAADIILNRKVVQINTPFKMINRRSI
jgi:DNA-binding LacI/PurR family transcriptional regulator